ncbi:MAG: hypothetical protein ACUVQ1_07935 [Candidatus Kapaibacteriales bacterium]
MKSKFRDLAPYFLLFAINSFIWLQTLKLNFFNDNYQILSYVEKASKGNFIKIFLSKDLSTGYYRPIPNLFHYFVLNFFDYNPLPFYFFQLILYTSLVLVLYKLMNELTNFKLLSFLMVVIFSLLPSHDIYLSWISTNGDLFATIFILTAVYCFIIKKSGIHLLIGFISTVFAYLSKESSFTLPLFFLAIAIWTRNWSNDNLKIILGSFFFLLLLLSFREFFLNIHFFEAKNLSLLSIDKLLINYPLSLALNLFPTFALSINTFWSVAILMILTIYFLIFWQKYKLNKPNFKENINLFRYGLVWNIIFSLPILPLLMRWYIILPSIGLIMILTYIFQSFSFSKKEIYGMLMPIIFLFVPINFYSQNEWQIASRKAQEILSASQKILTNKSKLLLWFVPCYYNSYYVLRSGRRQAFEFFSKIKFSEILFPLPTQISNGYGVHLIRQDKNEYEFSLKNIVKFSEESLRKNKIMKNDYYEAKVIEQDGNTIVKVKFVSRKEEYANFFYDGKNFVWFY